ncbi:hypothetical protein BGZ61DRAFT_443486 [Ilyonectria robusta]|uniref:uncharacterized protein n=1 Tax=Ilyonectria robusta TaxID=1079257 RepID=UPI001E8DD406|nr:uncharacterized protein BGZ61DRAFT_443486 [Ilyonectria robusta]KAH8734975.1 hypothetical protein BGZ61DRAFT_443486 [Ilyonectria robusta]
MPPSAFEVAGTTCSCNVRRPTGGSGLSRPTMLSLYKVHTDLHPLIRDTLHQLTCEQRVRASVGCWSRIRSIPSTSENTHLLSGCSQTSTNTKVRAKRRRLSFESNTCPGTRKQRYEWMSHASNCFRLALVTVMIRSVDLFSPRSWMLHEYSSQEPSK